MPDERISADRQTDLRILPNEFAWVMDGATGAIKTYVGPLSTSLQQAERQVAFNTRSGRFETTVETQQKIVAPEGWYVVLRNPTVKGDHPVDKSNTAPELHHGRIVNIPGPVSFALWPGQVAEVIEAHRLRADSYLVARIYNVTEANKWLPNWNERVAERPATLAPAADEGSDETDAQKAERAAPGELSSFTMGQLLIIQGDVWEFFLPPTGIEVIYDPEKRSHVRDAVSLERLEYCLLRDQNGNKRYVQGPAIVFPKPTEDFVRDGDAKKFRATELGPKQGVYIKVIAPYTDGDEAHSVGEELFITGEDTPIYFPRVEHMLIRYGSQEVHSGVAIPAGSALYVMDRMKGGVRIEKGPSIFLPDPRHEVVIKRNLPLHICALLYPGNDEALVANGGLPDGGTVATARGAEATLRGMASRLSLNASYGSTQVMDERVTRRTEAPQASSGFKGDSADRLGQYKAPRTITLGGKYDGAVGMDVWSGYAVMLVDKTGGRRVVVGPKTAILDYDELPHMVTLSTGRPKNMDNPRREAYLRVENNYVTDLIEAETSDYCTVNVKLVYRVNFVGEDQFKWFSVENYVKLLCDHMRSMVRNAVRKQTVKHFYESATDIIRDLVLGASEEGQRPGRLFEENGMRVIDVEVLKVSLADRIQKLIESREVQTLERDLQLETAKAVLVNTRETETLKLEELMVREKTREATEELARIATADKFKTDQVTVETRRQLSALVESVEQASARHQATLAAIERDRRAADESLTHHVKTEEQKLELELMEKEAVESARKFAAISPQLIAALQAVGDQATLTRVAEAMGAQGLLRTMGGDSVVDVLGKLLEGTTIGERLPQLLSSSARANGQSASLPAE